jgi:restriction system protein
MRPDEYEHIVAQHFETKGYKATVSQYSNDYGVDVFASKGKEKIAIQAKMFGGSTRPINRQMVMELHGAKDYFDCTKAIIATNGRIIDNALEVANKLKIEILNIPQFGLPTKPKGRLNQTRLKTFGKSM